jgi:hypothetical protein
MLKNNELDDILPEDQSGNFVLVPNAERDIERVRAGVYRSEAQRETDTEGVNGN